MGANGAKPISPVATKAAEITMIASQAPDFDFGELKPNKPSFRSALRKLPAGALQGTLEPFGALSPSPANKCSGFFVDDVDMPYLERFTYAPANGERWQVRPGPKGSGPSLKLCVQGHQEVKGHTLYMVECSMTAWGWFEVSWEAPRRLIQLREGLHGPLKQILGGKTYSQCFAQTPFARRGGLPGTTARLRGWFEALAECINCGKCPPCALAFVLQFLDTPPPSGGEPNRSLCGNEFRSPVRQSDCFRRKNAFCLPQVEED